MNYDKLLEPQKPHAKVLLDSLYLNGYAFDASPTGTGKTYTASWVARNISLPIVVVCPKASKTIWKDTLKEFNVTPHLIINYELLTRGNTPYLRYNKKEYANGDHWWESKGIKILFPKNCLVIVDECHKCRGQKSKNGEMMTALKNHGFRVLLLSATAAASVTDMKSFGYMLQLHNGENYRTFAKEHGAEPDGYGGLIWKEDTEKSKKGMVDIHNHLFNITKCASKMNIEDFGDIFPDNHIIAESFDLGDENSSKLQAVYDNMKDELARLDERSKNYTQHHFAIMMRARRTSELLKVPTTAEWIMDKYDEGITPVVFFNFTDSLHAVEERLGKAFSKMLTKVVGGQTDKQRNFELSEFQANRRNGALVNMNAGSASINMHDLYGDHPRESLICPSWSVVMTLQSIGRICRAHGKTKCVQKFLFASEIEERQRQRVASKVRNISELNDGDLSLVDAVPLY